MRKIILSIFTLMSAVSLSYGQGVTDVTHFGDNGIMGTARYMGMAGSFGALGGDPSAIIDNPAGLGIYRGSELSFTLNPTIINTTTGKNGQYGKANDFFFNFNQAALVLAFPSGREKGYVSSNFSFTYNRLKDFHRSVEYLNNTPSGSLSGYLAGFTNGFNPSSLVEENVYAPFLSVLGYQTSCINPGSGADSTFYSPTGNMNSMSAYKGVEYGRVEEYNFSYAANIAHVVYFGMALGIQTLDYRMVSDNGETFNATTDGTIPNMVLSNSYNAYGVGVNFKVGLIVRAAPFLRLGASIHTPTYYSMRESWTGQINTSGMAAEGNPNQYTLSSNSYFDYNSPLRFQASAAFIIGKSALINIDYQLADYQHMKLRDESSDGLFSGDAFGYENSEINRYAKLSHLIKVGAEYRIASTYSLRAGFAYQTPNIAESAPYNLMGNSTRTRTDYFIDKGSIYGAVGFGYRYNGFGIDIAYMLRCKTDGFATYQRDAQIFANDSYYGVAENMPQQVRTMTDVKSLYHNIAVTLLYKF